MNLGLGDDWLGLGRTDSAEDKGCVETKGKKINDVNGFNVKILTIKYTLCSSNYLQLTLSFVF